MALVNCKECGKEISDKAISCPNCGCVLNSDKVIVKRRNIEGKDIFAYIMLLLYSIIKTINLYKYLTSINYEKALNTANSKLFLISYVICEISFVLFLWFTVLCKKKEKYKNIVSVCFYTSIVSFATCLFNDYIITDYETKQILELVKYYGEYFVTTFTQAAILLTLIQRSKKNDTNKM